MHTAITLLILWIVLSLPAGVAIGAFLSLSNPEPIKERSRGRADR